MNEDEGTVPAIPELEATGDPAVDAVLADYARASAALNALDLTALVRLDQPSTGLHAVARTVEAVRRSTAAFDAHYVTAVEVGGEPARYAQPSTAVFLREQLRLSRGEARRRVDLAHAITPGRAFTGEVLPPALPALAAAVTAGVLSAEHARTILTTMDRLPSQVRQAHGAVVEAELVTAAGKGHPGRAGEARRGRAAAGRPGRGTARCRLRPHPPRATADQEPRPSRVRPARQLDQETGELARIVLDARSKPVPAADATTDLPDGTLPGRDARTLDERTHDAFHDVLVSVLNGGDLPASGGTPASMVWHLSDDQLRTRYGLAVSEHGTLIPAGDALRLCDQTQLYVLIETAKGVPLWLGRTTRIATPGQTVALAARDRGCSFPGCDRPPSHCQRHHITDWADDGPTDLDNLTLLCGYHHREHAKRGWACVMRDGLPHWRPPTWLDPHRTPIRNTRHHTRPDTG
jgi:hypothetical protein